MNPYINNLRKDLYRMDIVDLDKITKDHDILDTTKNEPDEKPFKNDPESIIDNTMEEEEVNNNPEEVITNKKEEPEIVISPDEAIVDTPIEESVQLLEEDALTSKQRKNLDSSEFGLPHLRKYPLTDEKRVKQAIRFFGYVKNKQDKETLAKNIIKRYKELNMTTKVGKKNPLYNYIPDDMKYETLNESGIANFNLNNADKAYNIKYYRIKNKEFAPLYIVLTANNTIAGKVIRDLTGGDYNHASISFDMNLETMFTFTIGEGFKVENTKKDEFNKYGLYVLLVNKKAILKARDKIQYYIDNEKDTKYNYLGVVMKALKIKPSTPSNMTMFCSEFVSNVLNVVSDDLIDDDPNTVAPMELLSNRMYQVSKGDMDKYDPLDTEKKIKTLIRSTFIKNHLIENSLFYNHVFYNPEMSKHIQLAKDYDILDYFYPSTRYGLINQMNASIGGLYTELKPKFNEIDFSLTDKGEVTDNFILNVDTYYDNTIDFYHKHGNKIEDKYLGDIYPHIHYCIHLYSIVEKLLDNKIFTMESLSPKEQIIIRDWSTYIKYYYALLQERLEDYPDDKDSDYILTIKQRLFDLLWNYHDNPDSNEIINANMVGVFNLLGEVEVLEESELLSKDEIYHYLIKDHFTNDDLYLLPELYLFPVLDSTSLLMAIDTIEQVAKEYPDNISNYIHNINRLYKKFDCTFKISVSHPYAKYATSDMLYREIMNPINELNIRSLVGTVEDNEEDVDKLLAEINEVLEGM